MLRGIALPESPPLSPPILVTVQYTKMTDGHSLTVGHNGRSMTATARRQREKEARREAILDAGQALVAECGYAAMTMGAVAKKAELSKGTLYLYFDNRDALCAAIAQRTISDFIPLLRARLTAESRGIDKLRSVLLLNSEFYSSHPQQLRFASSWIFSASEIDDSSEEFQSYRQLLGQVLSLVVDAFAIGQEDGSLRRDIDPVVQSLQLWTSFLGVMLATINRQSLEKRFPQPLDLAGLMEVHIRSTLRSLAADPAEVDA